MRHYSEEGIVDLFEAEMEGTLRSPHTIAFGSMWGLVSLAVFDGRWDGSKLNKQYKGSGPGPNGGAGPLHID